MLAYITAAAAVLSLLLLAACVVVYAGEQRMLQPACLANCDATAARLEGSASSVIQQSDDSQGHLSPRGETTPRGPGGRK